MNAPAPLSGRSFRAAILSLDGVVLDPSATGVPDGQPRVFPGTLEFLAALEKAEIPVAVLAEDESVSERLALAGLSLLVGAHASGDPATRLAGGVSALGADAGACLVIAADAAEVDAAVSAGCACVIGVEREEGRDVLDRAGADLTISDLSDLSVAADGTMRLKHAAELPSALETAAVIPALAGSARVAILLDYDGTLTPIVTDYRDARLDPGMRDTLESLAARYTVAVISGRDLADVRSQVGLDELYYSGSHGFELAGPGDFRHVHEEAGDFLEDLEQAGDELCAALADIPGHAVERKQFSIAVHYRRVAPEDVDRLTATVDRVLRESGRLKKGFGKKVFELKPALEWDKGRAVELLLRWLGHGDDGAIAVYIGDDVTDEAAFRVLRPPDISIVVDDSERVTAADYRLADCREVHGFLEQLLRRPPGPESGGEG